MFHELKNGITNRFPVIQRLKHRIEVAGKTKIFCIGMSKTGTTSLTKAFSDLGFRVATGKKVAQHFPNYATRDFRSIIKYCKTAQVFQDHYFGLPYTFQVLDQAFPGSKFILSIRDNADIWYQSYLNQQIRSFANDGKIPSREMYQKIEKIPGLKRWDYENIKYDTPDDDILDEQTLKQAYLRHNDTVLDYFRERKQDLLVINLADENSYSRFCKFLDVEPLYDRFPHMNKGEYPKMSEKNIEGLIFDRF